MSTSSYKKYVWKEENKPEGWEEIVQSYYFNDYNQQVSAPREKIFCEYDETKWRYRGMSTSYRSPIRNDFHDEFEYTTRCMMAIILTVSGEVRYKASNGVYIVSISSGTQWIETERRLHVCRVFPGMVPCGNTGIIVNEGSFNEIIQAINEYNRPQETPVRTSLPDFISYYEYNGMEPARRAGVRRLYHRDELMARWIRNDYTVPVTKKVIVDDKILSDDMFKVE